MGDAELQNKMDHLKESIDTLDTTMTDVGAKIDITNAGLSTLDTTMTTMSSKIDDTNTKLDTLASNLGTVNTSIQALIAALNSLSSKYTTPENLDVITSAHSARFKFYPIRVATTVTNWGSPDYQGLTFDGKNWYAFDDAGNTIDYWSGATQSVFCTPTANSFQAWDWTNNNKLYALSNGEIETFNASGLLIYNAVLTHDDWSVGDWVTMGLAHDEDNDVLYAIIYNSLATTDPARVVIVNPTTGALTDSSTIDPIAYNPNFIQDMEILNEKMFVLTVSYGVLIYELGTSLPYAVVDLPIYPRDMICADKNARTWHFLDDDPSGTGIYGSVNIRGLAYMDRVGLQSQVVSSLPNAVARVVTNTGNQISPADSSREALHIVNTSTTITAYIGDSSVTTITGTPLLPYQSMVFKGYSGEVYGITASGTANLRIIELR